MTKLNFKPVTKKSARKPKLKPDTAAPIPAPKSSDLLPVNEPEAAPRRTADLLPANLYRDL